MLLIGDAAGLACMQSGEGIRPAIESGILAAGVIKNAQGDYSDRNLKPYQRSLAGRFGSRTSAINVLQFIPDSIRQFLARHLISNHWFASKVIIDDWFLHVHQRPLLLG